MLRAAFGLAAALAILIAGISPATAQIGPCDAGTWYFDWSGFVGVPTQLQPLSVDLTVQYTGSGNTTVRSTGVSGGSGSTSWTEYFRFQITGITYTNSYGTGMVDIYNLPDTVPSGYSGWCYEFSWDGQSCYPMRIKVRPVRC